MTVDDTIFEYQAFIESLKPIFRYAVDMSLLPTDVLVAPRPFEISEDEFLARLYIYRPQEDEILRELVLTPNTILLIGEKGSGKTSLCLNAMNDFKKNDQKILIIRMDVRSEVFSDDIRLLDPKTIDSELLEKLREKYLHEVFPFRDIEIKNEPGKFENPFLKLIAFLVDPYSYKPRGFENESISISPRIWYNRYINTVKERKGNVNYYDWLVDTYASDEKVGDYIQDIANSGKLNVQILMHAAQLIYKYERQCILIDNIDTLELEQQANIQSVVKRLVPNISQIGNFIISCRDRSIFKEYEFDETQSPTFVTRVRMYTPGRDLVPAIQLQKVSFEVVRNIVRRRLDYAFLRFNENVAKEENIVKNINAPQKSFFDRHISRSVFENIVECSNKILALFSNINGSHFFNNSIRLALDNHCEFLQFLISAEINRFKKSDQKEVFSPIFNNYSVRGLTTEYLAWIRRNNVTENSVGFYDVIADKDAWLESRKEIIGCSLEHLIITATWNLTIRKPLESTYVYKIPKIKEVISKLKIIGYEEEEIKKVMFSLYHEDDIRTHFIEIQPIDPVPLRNSNDIKDEYNIYVTPRGKSLTGFVINTFGYTFECVLNHMNQRKKPLPEPIKDFRYLEINEVQAIDFIIPHLCEIAEMHISTLLKFREKVVAYQGRDWFYHYLDDFGVPVSAERGIGRAINGKHAALQFELMIAGIIEFVKNSNIAKEKLLELESEFKTKLEQIIKFKEDPDKISFNVI